MEQTAISIVQDLREAGHEAYFAGGCVRDILLKKDPVDYDIVTSALPDRIEEIVSHTIPVGKKFGIIIAVKNGHHFEIATFRSDSSEGDGRRPDYVTFTNAKEDAMRRDFTINGMFYDPIDKKVIDYVGGKNDLKARVLRFIGEPGKRIEEDFLRIVRAVRFRNSLDFQYDPKTYQALREYAVSIEKVTPERIRDEMNKIMKLKCTDKVLVDLEDLRIIEHILPELLKLKGVAQPLEYHQEGDVWEHLLRCMRAIPSKAPLIVHWAMLLHDIGKVETFEVKKDRIHFNQHAHISGEMAKKILRRFRFSNRDIHDVVWLIKHHMMMQPLLTMTKRRKLHWYHHPQFHNLLRVMRADIMGSKPQDFSVYRKIRKDYLQLKKEEKHKPLLSGKDLIKKFNLKPGEIIGKILKEVEHQHLEEKIHTKEEAYEVAEGLI